jgi:hypothetical protein
VARLRDLQEKAQDR